MTPLRARLAEAQLALMLLTRLPAGRLPDAPPLARTVWAFPLVGLAVGLVGALALLAAQALGLPPGIAAGLALAAMMLATGALHEDGLADVADGFGGGRDAAQKLAIMRDSRIGSYGTLALTVSVGLRWQALAVLGPAALIAAAVLSRGGLPALMRALPPARPDGLGRSTGDGVTGLSALTSALIAAALALALLGPLNAAAALIAATLGAALIAHLARRQIGGQTGDVLGAAQQAAEIAALLALTTL